MNTPLNPDAGAVLVIRLLPKVGGGVTEVARLDGRGGRVILSKHPHGADAKHLPPDLTPVFHDAVLQGLTNVVVDLSAVPWLDSTGIGMLVGWYRTVNDLGGRIVFAHPTDTVIDLFRITKLEKVFSIHGTLHDAITELHGGNARKS